MIILIEISITFIDIAFPKDNREENIASFVEWLSVNGVKVINYWEDLKCYEVKDY